MEYASEFQQYAKLPKTEVTLREWINGMNLDKTIGIIKKWQIDNKFRMKSEFVKERDVETYEKANKEEDKKQKKIMIDNYVNQYSKEFAAWGVLTEDNIKKFKNIYLNDMDDRYNNWRRKLSPYSLLLNSAYLKFAQILIQKLMKAVIIQYNLTSLKLNFPS
ncbi:unnamed protein product [Meloidogyne enterolobii]|uniref:Uncharacterized protein n=1 Tax=Meloidogyne enterolobii TaxID=390850 RepID=A0ACB1A8D5_MELEN